MTTCRHCHKEIRMNHQGYWGARRRNDPHPWYCDADASADKCHVPA